MKKFLVLTFSLILLSLGISSKTYAVTDGCPDTWKIDLNQYPNQELLSVKQKLGFNLVSSEQRKLINFKGPLGEMPKVLGFRTNLLFDPLAYLYSNSQVQIDTKVEVKGCVNSGNFQFITNWFQSFNDGIFIIKEISSEEFGNSYPKIMGDFQKQKDFMPYINLIQSEIIKVGNIWSTEKVASSWDYNYIQPRNISRILKIQNLWSEDQLFTYIRTPNCLEVKSEPEIPYFYQISKSSGKCKFSLGYVESDRNNQTLFLFEPFELDFTNKKSTINCTNGKTTKKVSGTHPKCPKGYKVKA